MNTVIIEQWYWTGLRRMVYWCDAHINYGGPVYMNTKD